MAVRRKESKAPDYRDRSIIYLDETDINIKSLSLDVLEAHKNQSEQVPRVRHQESALRKKCENKDGKDKAELDCVNLVPEIHTFRSKSSKTVSFDDQVEHKVIPGKKKNSACVAVSKGSRIPVKSGNLVRQLKDDENNKKSELKSEVIHHGHMNSVIKNENINLTLSSLEPPNVKEKYWMFKKKPFDCKGIYVCGIPKKATESVLKEVFSIFGCIERISYFEKKNYAYITFLKRKAVDRALNLSGYTLKINNLNAAEYVGKLKLDFSESVLKELEPAKPLKFKKAQKYDTSEEKCTAKKQMDKTERFSLTSLEIKAITLISRYLATINSGAADIRSISSHLNVFFKISENETQGLMKRFPLIFKKQRIQENSIEQMLWFYQVDKVSLK